MARRLIFDGAAVELGQLPLQAPIEGSGAMTGVGVLSGTGDVGAPPGPTRLYLRSDDSLLGTFDTSALLADSFFTLGAPPVFSMGPTRSGSPLTTTAPIFAANGTAPALAVFVSPPVAEAFALVAEPLQLLVQAIRIGGVSSFPGSKAWILNGDGTIKTTIKTAGLEGSFNSVGTSLEGRFFVNQNPLIDFPDVDVGDRIAIAISSEAFNADCEVSIRVGDPVATDLDSPGDTDTGDTPWLDIGNVGIVFADEGIGGGDIEGDGALTGTSTMAGSGDVAAIGSGALVGVGMLSGAGGLSISGQGALVGVAALAGAGGLAVSGSGTLVAASALAGVGGLAAVGSGALAGVGSLSGSGGLAASGSGTLVAVAALAGAGGLAVSGQGALSAIAVVAGTGGLAVSGQGSLSGEGVLAGQGGGTTGEGDMTGEGVLAGTGDLAIFGSSALAGLGVLAGAGGLASVGSGTLTAQGALSGSGGLSVSGQGALGGVGTLSGTGGLSVAGSGAFSGVSPLSGTGGLAAGGGGALVGDGALDGSGSLSVSGQGALASVGVMAGTGVGSVAVTPPAPGPPPAANVSVGFQLLDRGGSVGGAITFVKAGAPPGRAGSVLFVRPGGRVGARSLAVTFVRRR